MQQLTESALLNPETKQVQCNSSLKVHCRTQKSSKCNAQASQKDIAAPRKQASAHKNRAQKPQQRFCARHNDQYKK
jgi:hypothetical protein